MTPMVPPMVPPMVSPLISTQTPYDPDGFALWTSHARKGRQFSEDDDVRTQS